jgi:hypothetical protein
MNSELPYIPLQEFNAKVEQYAKTNYVLSALMSHPAKPKTWEHLPPRLINDLFETLGCKPSIQKY